MDVDISGQIDNVRINGVDVVPLVEAELDRRYPDRATMRPGDSAGYREAWDVLERLWQQRGVWLPGKTCCGAGEPDGRLLRWISAAPRKSGRRTGS